LDRQPLPPSPIRPHDASGVVREAVDAFASRLDEHDPFVAAFDHCITPMVVSDPTLPDNPLVYVNRAFEALTPIGKASFLSNTFLPNRPSDRNKCTLSITDAAPCTTAVAA